MRYSKNENNTLVGYFEPGSSVKIDILAIDTDNKLILDDDICIESQEIPGIFLWNTRSINASNGFDHYSNLVYKMYNTNTGEIYLGKFAMGGYLDNRFDDIDTKLSDISTTLNKLDDIINNNNIEYASINQDLVDLKNKLDNISINLNNASV